MAAPPDRDQRCLASRRCRRRPIKASEITRLKRELERIDARLAALAQERQALEDKLTQPLPPAEIAECGRKLKAGADETAGLEEKWLDVSGELEALQSAAAEA